MEARTALVRIIASFLIIGCFFPALEAKAKQRSSSSKRSVAGRKKTVNRRKRKTATKPRTIVKANKSAYKYLPKLREYAAPVKVSQKKKRSHKNQQKKKTVGSRKASRTKKNSTYSRKHVQKRPIRGRKALQTREPEKIFSWPVEPKSFWLSSPFGPRTIRGKEGFHTGVDLAAPTGTDVYAAGSGTVVEARYSSGYGNYILIAHPNGYKSRYAHLSRSLVKHGQQVEEGELIGKVGSTGHVVKRSSSSSGAHLHWELYRDGSWVDPVTYIR